jgi:hypothetical protein
VYEKERAQLITRATVAEGQVSELQGHEGPHAGEQLAVVPRGGRLLALRTQRAPQPLEGPKQGAAMWKPPGRAPQ